MQKKKKVKPAPKINCRDWSYWKPGLTLWSAGCPPTHVNGGNIQTSTETNAHRESKCEDTSDKLAERFKCVKIF